jgi:hypothetical protein
MRKTRTGVILLFMIPPGYDPDYRRRVRLRQGNPRRTEEEEKPRPMRLNGD